MAKKTNDQGGSGLPDLKLKSEFIDSVIEIEGEQISLNTCTAEKLQNIYSYEKDGCQLWKFLFEI